MGWDWGVRAGDGDGLGRYLRNWFVRLSGNEYALDWIGKAVGYICSVVGWLRGRWMSYIRQLVS